MTASFRLDRSLLIEGIRSSNRAGSVLPNNLAILDFNGNGYPDIYISRISWGDKGDTPSEPILVLDFLTEQSVRLSLESDGNKFLTSYVARTKSGDFNGDGFDDLFVIETGPDHDPFSGGRSLFIFGNSSKPDLLTSSSLPVVFNHGASVGDVNSDGLDDVLVVTGFSQIGKNHNYVILGTTATTVGRVIDLTKLQPTFDSNYPWNPSYQIVQGALSAKIADINADGFLDYVLAGNPVTVFLGDGEGGFLTKAPIRAGIPDYFESEAEVVCVSTIDLNGDQYPDLVVGSVDKSANNFYGAFRIDAYLNNEGTSFSRVTDNVIPSDIYWWLESVEEPRWNIWPKELVVEDFDRDGDDDLFVVNDSGGVQVLENQEGRFGLAFDSLAYQIKGLDNNSGLRDTMAVADVNSDGLPDILQANGFEYYLQPQTSGIEVLLNASESGDIFKAKFEGGKLLGTYRSELFLPSLRSDEIHGGAGVDVARYKFVESSFHREKTETVITLQRIDANWDSDTLASVERVEFLDKNIAFDLDHHAGQVAKLLGAVFGSDSVSNAEYVGIGLDLLDGGMSYTDLASLAVSVSGKTSSTDVCNLLWENVIGSPATASDVAPFKAMLDSGQMSIGGLAALAADTSFNTTNIDLVGLARTGLGYD